ncbi:hypothetical protein BU23DRAFT_150269 [Bimuria novae-zelandiae CBS 107.79]|uniref:SnoaL-like domain-containing protein n=1 Tax=Bimuria novae-zelandiae CBS 107.79 TaxID=1447943 RepID=A0A6A5VNA8_9PLEO|nr:hypothetical protein BU23DRAFT_150269 [Bimuria novae-zelandiae CBS 107.79]
MKLPTLLTLASAALHVYATPAGPSSHEAIAAPLYAFYRALDLKSAPLLLLSTTEDLVFDGTAFASIGIGAPVPLVGQDVIVPSLLSSLKMTTMHNLANVQVEEVGGGGEGRANVTAYVLAYHHKELFKPSSNTGNVYLMGNLAAAGVVRKEGGWKVEKLTLIPFFQSGNKVVMGL